MEKYLIINPFGIGDVLFTTPIIKALKEAHPGCFIGYWCNDRVGDLLRSNRKIDRVFALSRGDIKRMYGSYPIKRLSALYRLIRDIRSEGFDIAFDYSLDCRYGLWSKLAGIKRRIGLNYKRRGRFLTDKIDLREYSGKHVIEHNLDLLGFVNIEPKDKVPELIISEEDRAGAHDILKEHGVASTDILIGVAPGGGASWGKDSIYKQWPARKFAELASELIRNSNAKVVLLGSVDEKPIAEIVLGKMGLGKMGQSPLNRIVDLVGKLNLKELAAVINELGLLICNDGGPLHMAVALGVNTVSIFGPVDERVYGPYPPSAKHIVVKSKLPCRPCYRDFRFKGCLNHIRCLEDITVEDIFGKAKSLL